VRLKAFNNVLHCCLRIGTRAPLTRCLMIVVGSLIEGA
jgi:hypothetical protein